jgi:hypothetical protein
MKNPSHLLGALTRVFCAWSQTGSDENLALVSQTRKGKGKGSNKKGNSEGETSQSGKKKDLSKVKCFACHKSGHYASQCPEEERKRKIAAGSNICRNSVE